MFDLFLRRARLIDDAVNDIVLRSSKITALGDVDGPTLKTIELGGECYVSAGWIDSHIHCYPKSPICHDQPDSVDIATGVTIVVGAGSIGVDDVGDPYTPAQEAVTEVYALLSISHMGFIAQNELTNIASINADTIRETVKRHPDFIVGLKARIGNSVVGENGVMPLGRARTMQAQNGDLPLMAHIGNDPPNLDDIIKRLNAGDIIIHCYNGKPNRTLTPQGELQASVTRAILRNVRLDVGHGTTSLNLVVIKRVIGLGILPHTISPDIYCHDRISGPVHSLANVMSKFLATGMSLPQVIGCVTANIADGLRLKQRERLQVGLDADLTLFTLRCQPAMLVDTENGSLQAEQLLVPLAVTRAGKGYMTKQGGAEHAFDFQEIRFKTGD